MALALRGRRLVFEIGLNEERYQKAAETFTDPRSGELWGNYPQTYSLVGIITSAMRLSRPWEDAL